MKVQQTDTLMQMHISAGSTALLTCNNCTNSICQVYLQMVRTVTHTWRITDSKNKKDKKKKTSTAPPDMFLLNQGPRSPANPSALRLSLRNFTTFSLSTCITCILILLPIMNSNSKLSSNAFTFEMLHLWGNYVIKKHERSQAMKCRRVYYVCNSGGC